MHIVMDLEVYYYRKLPNLYRIIEELVEVDRNAINLIIKVISIMEYFVYTGYRVSIIIYREIVDPIVGIS